MHITGQQDRQGRLYVKSDGRVGERGGETKKEVKEYCFPVGVGVGYKCVTVSTI